MTIFISFLFSIIASFIAAFVAHHLATSRMQKSELSKFQVQAYADFIGAVARMSVARREGDTTTENIDITSLNDAKSRILACGHKEVVEATLNFWKTGATLELESGIQTYTSLIRIMRKSLGHKQHDLHGLDISDAIFQLEPSSYSYRAERKGKE